ncbi:class C sortase [Roseburia hominis]
MGKKKRLLLGIVFILIGTGCFLYPDFREWKLQQKVDQMIEKFENEHSQSGNQPGKREERRKTTFPVSGELQKEEIKPGSGMTEELYLEMKRYNENLVAFGQSIADAWSYEQAPVGITSLESDESVIGYIEIPDMEVRLPLFLGASDANLAKGAAVLSGTSMPIGGKNTNCVIAGHRGWRGSACFLYIENAKIGSEVYITNPWETLTYKVTDREVVDPWDSDSIMIREGKDMVTLITCHPYTLGNSPYRYLVFCERMEAEDTKSAAKEIEKGNKSFDILSDEREWKASNGLIYWESCIRIGMPIIGLITVVILMLVRSKSNRRQERER